MLRAGRYDQKITFIEFTPVSNGSGGTIVTPVEVLTTFASVEQLKQSRNIEQVQLGLPSTLLVGVQVRKGFKPTVAMVVRWRGVDHQIITSPYESNVRTALQWTFNITASNG